MSYILKGFYKAMGSKHVCDCAKAKELAAKGVRTRWALVEHDGHMRWVCSLCGRLTKTPVKPDAKLKDLIRLVEPA